MKHITMIKREIIKKIEEDAREYFIGANGCHDWTHVERVKKLALKIGKQEKAELDVLEISALLHDIGRKKEMKQKGAFCHAEKGAELSRVILDRYKIEKSKAENIIHSVIAHRFRNSHKPETIEAKVLYDADKLDSLGAVGISRIFLFAGHSGSNTLYTGNEKKLAKEEKSYSYTKEDSAFLEYEVKLKHIHKKMFTRTGKKMARERHEFMKNYFTEFWLEVKGLK